MKAILVVNGSLKVCEIENPVEKENEIRIEIHAAALNRADLLQKKGAYPSPEGWPQWSGLELAGKILALGKEAEKYTDFKVGDDVCALVGGGAYAEEICVPYNLVLPMPKGLSYEEAAAIPESYATSYLNLFKEGHLQEGQTVYVAAGASGLASAAIPMAKGFGATVITDVIDPAKKEAISSLGADYIADLTKEKVSDVFRRMDEAGTPVNCAMDCLCGNDMGEALQYMAEDGYWMDGVEMLETRAEIYTCNEQDLQKHKKTLFGMYQGEAEEVVFEAESEIVDRLFDMFGDEIRFEDNGDGKLRFKAEVQISPTFIVWCLSFGDKLKVIAPEKVKERLSSYTEQLYNLYKD